MLLGIDVGTSGCRAALFDESGGAVCQTFEGYGVNYPKNGWAEQDPDVWWAAVCRAVSRAMSESGTAPCMVDGIGIGGQSWSAVPVDGGGRALRETPIWMDTRAQDVCDDLNNTVGNERIFKFCGNPVKPNYTFPKILWYKKHERELYDKTDKILQSNGFIAFRLTGEVSQDLSQGYGHFCFDMEKGVFDLDFCREMGVKPSLLPEIFPCSHIIGRTTREAASLCGLAEGVPVVAGGLDAACGTLGAGVIEAGETQEQGGQAGGMSICTDRCVTDPRLITSFHVTPGRWLLQGGTVGGGGVCKWMRGSLCGSETGFGEMDEMAEKIPPGCEGLVFLPYMAGERSPVWDPYAKGVYYGLDYSKTKAHMIRAGLEGVAFSLRHNLETAGETGVAVTELRAMGGSANSLLWTQIKSDVTGKRITVPSSDTATTLGAALLAGVAVGAYAGFKEAVERTVSVVRTHEPNRENSGIYGETYDTYLSLYERLKGLAGGNTA